MKQIFPFLLIGLIVGGAMLFLNDTYEQEVFEPEWAHQETTRDWEAILFVNDINSETPEIGIRLDHRMDDTEIDALEFFMETERGGFFYQNLQMDDFDGTITYSEECTFCQDAEKTPYSHGMYGNLILNWRENGEIRSEYFYFDIQQNNWMNEGS